MDAEEIDGGADHSMVLTALRDLAQDLNSKGIRLREIKLSFEGAGSEVALQDICFTPEILEDPEPVMPNHAGLQGVFVLFTEQEDDL